MSAPVTLVTIHHEGAGTPSDDPRGADGGYTYWIGSTTFTHLRDVWSSYGTLNYNGSSVDVCLSGNRMTSSVTANDIELIHNALVDARNRGYVVNDPLVRAHKNSPGSGTVCPGDNTVAEPTWGQIVNACQASSVPQPTAPGGAVNIVATSSGKGYWVAAANGGVFCYGDAKFHGSMGDKKLNAPIVGMDASKAGDGYLLAGSDGGVFCFGKVKYHGSMGGQHLNEPIVSVALDGDGSGYWLLASDGGIFSFGSKFFGAPTGKV